jgi:hypothetical protein
MDSAAWFEHVLQCMVLRATVKHCGHPLICEEASLSSLGCGCLTAWLCFALNLAVHFAHCLQGSWCMLLQLLKVFYATCVVIHLVRMVIILLYVAVVQCTPVAILSCLIS